MTQSQSSRSFDSTSISISTRIVDQNENDWTMSNNYSKKLALLKKIYKDDDKFDIIDDNFDFKILIFYDKCKRANLLRIAYDENVSIMLRD
jgi:superfamily II DNA/RNA helicase